MQILIASSLLNLAGNFETGTDFTIANLYDDDLAVYAKSIDDASQTATITFNCNSLSVLSLLNINSYENNLKIYTRLQDGTNDILKEDITIETTSQKKATFEFDNYEDVNIELTLKTDKTVVTIGEIKAGNFATFGIANLPLEESQIEQTGNFVELDNGSDYYFYTNSEINTDILNSYNFTLLFKERANKLAFQSFMNTQKKRNMLVKISDLPEHIKFGKIDSYPFTMNGNTYESNINFKEVL